MLESILACEDERNTDNPEVMAVLCDESDEKLHMECKLLDLQCSHIRSKKMRHAVGSEKDREELHVTTACWGTLHCTPERVTYRGRVFLPKLFSERLLVLAALIRARSDTSSLAATPGPWVHTLMYKWLDITKTLCIIDEDQRMIQWREFDQCTKIFGFDAKQFSDQNGMYFDATTFDSLSGHGPGAAERLVGSMARLGLIDMHYLPDILPLGEIVPFRSCSHGVRIVGWCPQDTVEERAEGREGREGRELPGLIPEILELVGFRLLKKHLICPGKRNFRNSTYTDPLITTWHHIWAVFRQIVVTLTQGERSCKHMKTCPVSAALRKVRRNSNLIAQAQSN